MKNKHLGSKFEDSLNTDDYKINFKIKTIPSFCEIEKEYCLDVLTSISDEVSRFYYKNIETEYIRNMPNQLLLKLHKQLEDELTRREK